MVATVMGHCGVMHWVISRIELVTLPTRSHFICERKLDCLRVRPHSFLSSNLFVCEGELFFFFFFFFLDQELIPLRERTLSVARTNSFHSDDEIVPLRQRPRSIQTTNSFLWDRDLVPLRRRTRSFARKTSFHWDEELVPLRVRTQAEESDAPQVKSGGSIPHKFASPLRCTEN
jgi:hypothetical protein